MNLFKKYANIILKHADIYKPAKHNTKYSNKYYLTHILDVLETVVNYKSLMKLQSIKSNYEYHYKTINKKHIEWSQNGVYENAYKEILQINNSCKITTNNYIDTTLIVNKCGVEGIGYGCGESRKKKYTSIAVVCNENIKPISILCSLNYTKKLNETMKEKIFDFFSSLNWKKNEVFLPMKRRLLKRYHTIPKVYYHLLKK